jgi:DNA replication protein DnaC
VALMGSGALGFAVMLLFSGAGSTIVTTQLPIEHWHEMIPNPTIADAIHNAHRLSLNGESMRKATVKRAGLDVKQDA